MIFHSITSENKYLQTYNGLSSTIVGEMPNIEVEDHYLSSVEEQYEKHKNKYSGYKNLEKILNLEFFKNHSNEYFDHLIKNKHVKENADKELVLNFKTKVATSFKVLANQGKIKPLVAERSARFNQILEKQPIENHVNGYFEYENIQKEKIKKKSKSTFWFFATMLLFAVSLSGFFDLLDLVSIVLVVFIHELGHILGMYLFSYKDLKILFLPFVGALAVGEKRRGRQHIKKLLFSFLGQCPGL